MQWTGKERMEGKERKKYEGEEGVPRGLARSLKSLHRLGV
jgi:hypothetical protein